MSTPPTDPTPENPGDAIADKAKSAYQWWDDLATLKEDDSFLVGTAKILVRLVGILVLLAMSPLIIMGFIMAFIAVA